MDVLWLWRKSALFEAQSPRKDGRAWMGQEDVHPAGVGCCPLIAYNAESNLPFNSRTLRGKLGKPRTEGEEIISELHCSIFKSNCP